MKDPKFELYTFWDSDEYYPMELVYGCFYYPGGKGDIPMRGGYSKQIGYRERPWGEANHLSSSHKEQLLPDKLELKWYSFVEDKSYWGSFDLPYDRLLEIFQQTYIRHRLKDGSSAKEAYITAVDNYFKGAMAPQASDYYVDKDNHILP